MQHSKRTEKFNLVLEDGIAGTHPRTSQKSRGTSSSWYYFGLVGQIGFSIAVPIAGGAIGGSFIDQYFHTYPRWTLGLLMLGVVVSVVTFYQTIKTLLKK
ncbi:hypothetical protein A2875_00155 [Candidatus Gottesmanbacteria bacterium RIFCSPHIGHO2_01_FULL_46_14]|uniref:AtpZ/AtpI family protein n=2 Tax=Candidatus Gottesmaniibacteriota TaxID=1752720 RepID=A0A1F5ZL04_9BACT|nr:MAG: hypothetical protein A2875_00155 [Candidatus Gottesmanbacteria bacterium RIFCSPHIGHO2_01_FULL_46_14]OGG29019.1 MAG: hypothetical protein A2971_03295 [Candidatus Gottesmanbacteria bacterium RIFCSPLOWO2_01_FULL_46_21]